MPTKLQPWKESVCLLHFQWQIVSYCAIPWSVLEFMKDYAELSMLIKIVDIKIKNTAKTVPHFLSNITANVRMRSVFKDCSPRLSSPSRCLLVGSFLSSDTSSTIVSWVSVKCCVIYRKPSKKFNNNQYNASYILENNLQMHNMQLHLIFLSYNYEFVVFFSSRHFKASPKTVCITPSFTSKLFSALRMRVIFTSMVLFWLTTGRISLE